MLQGLQDLPHIHLVLLVGLAADDNVIHLSKGSLSTCRWKDTLAFLRPKGVVIAVFACLLG